MMNIFRKTKLFLTFTILFLACAAAYFNSLNYDFVFDDIPLIAENPFIKGPDALASAFQKNLFESAYDSSKPNYYRPLQAVSLVLDYRVWKLNPFGYRLTNVCLHLLNSLLVFALIYLLFENYYIALGAGLFFSLHPVNTTVVTYISGRADLLVSLFILSASLSAVLGLKYRRNIKLNFAAVILFSALALLSRESAIIAPLVILFVSSFTGAKARNKIYLSLAALALVSIYLYIRCYVLNIPVALNTLIRLNPFLTVINFMHIIVSYLFILIIPVNLSLMHATTAITSFSDIRFWITVSVFFALAAALFLKRKNRPLVFGAGWFFIFTMQVLPLMNASLADKLIMAEHWLYPAHAGFFTAIGIVLYSLKAYNKKTGYFMLASFAFIFTGLTILNNYNFKDRIVLSKRMLQFNDNNKEAHKELADAYLSKKKSGPAYRHIQRALQIAPFDAELYLLEGMYYEDRGKIDAAISSYEKMLKISPNSSRACNNLGALYLNKGDFNRAQVYFKQAIKFNPFIYEPYFNLAKLYYKNKELDNALLWYEKTLELNPDTSQAVTDLSMIYLEKGDLKGAAAVLDKALSRGSPDAQVLVMSGIVNSRLEKPDKALYYFNEALKTAPKSDFVMLNLGAFYANNNRLDKAVQIWQEGLKINPGNKLMKEHLESAMDLLDTQTK